MKKHDLNHPVQSDYGRLMAYAFMAVTLTSCLVTLTQVFQTLAVIY